MKGAFPRDNWPNIAPKYLNLPYLYQGVVIEMTRPRFFKPGPQLNDETLSDVEPRITELRRLWIGKVEDAGM